MRGRWGPLLLKMGRGLIHEGAPGGGGKVSESGGRANKFYRGGGGAGGWEMHLGVGNTRLDLWKLIVHKVSKCARHNSQKLSGERASSIIIKLRD